MSVLDSIKNDANKNRTTIQTTQDKELEHKLNALHYLDKDIDNELMFLKHVMTRGQETFERKGLHASAIIVSDNKFCLRQQVLSLFYKQLQGEQVAVATKRIFTEGDAIHEKWQRLFIRGGYAHPLDLDKTQFVKQYDLQFTPDIICTIDGEKYIGEIKSVNSISFVRMKKENKPHASGLKQLQLYMYLTGIHKGFVLCENKNTQEIKVNIYDFDYKAVRPFVKRLESIQQCKTTLIDKKRIIRRSEHCEGYCSKMAMECPMREVCYGRSKERI